MNTTHHLSYTNAAYQRKPTFQASVLNRLQAFANTLLGLFAPADDPAALRYMSAKYQNGID